jgi:hypothetical protein
MRVRIGVFVVAVAGAAICVASFASGAARSLERAGAVAARRAGQRHGRVDGAAADRDRRRDPGRFGDGAGGTPGTGAAAFDPQTRTRRTIAALPNASWR